MQRNYKRHSRKLIKSKSIKSKSKSKLSNLKVVLEWYDSNQMVANPGKFQYKLLYKNKSLKIEIERLKLRVKLLGFTFDDNLTFDTDISYLCITAGAKIKSLRRVRDALDEKQVKQLQNVFICHSVIIVLKYGCRKLSYRIVYHKPHMSLEQQFFLSVLGKLP